MTGLGEWWNDDQALAYAIVEQGRVTCAQLITTQPTPRVERRLAAAHNGFGLAGYTISDHLLTGVRRVIHQLIERSGPAPIPGASGVEQALMFAIHAAREGEHAGVIPRVRKGLRLR